jgi:hypothetical protein
MMIPAAYRQYTLVQLFNELSSIENENVPITLNMTWTVVKVFKFERLARILQSTVPSAIQKLTIEDAFNCRSTKEIAIGAGFADTFKTLNFFVNCTGTGDLESKRLELESNFKNILESAQFQVNGDATGTIY